VAGQHLHLARKTGITERDALEVTMMGAVSDAVAPTKNEIYLNNISTRNLS